MYINIGANNGGELTYRAAIQDLVPLTQFPIPPKNTPNIL